MKNKQLVQNHHHQHTPYQLLLKPLLGQLTKSKKDLGLYPILKTPQMIRVMLFD